MFTQEAHRLEFAVDGDPSVMDSHGMCFLDRYTDTTGFVSDPRPMLFHELPKNYESAKGVFYMTSDVSPKGYELVRERELKEIINDHDTTYSNRRIVR